LPVLFGTTGSCHDAGAVCCRGGQKQPKAGDKTDRPYWKTVEIGANDKKHTLKNEAWTWNKNNFVHNSLPLAVTLAQRTDRARRSLPRLYARAVDERVHDARGEEKGGGRVEVARVEPHGERGGDSDT
jgi:hypothetical protein